MDHLVYLPALLQLDWCQTNWMPPEGDAGVVFLAEKPIRYVDPSALVMLSAWRTAALAAGRAVGCDDSVKSPEAWRSGLLSVLAGRDVALDTDRRMFARLEVDLQIPDTVRELRGRLRLDDDAAQTLAYGLSEMLRNVFEHAASPTGAIVAASEYRNTGRVTVAVADIGLTIPEHITRIRLPGAPAREAFEAAFEPHVSGANLPDRNGGYGLYFTPRLVTAAGGLFWLRSGRFGARCGADDFAAAGRGPTFLEAEGVWPGTVVAMSLFPDRAPRFEGQLRKLQTEVLGGTAGGLDVFREPDAAAPTTRVRVPVVGGVAEDKLEAARLRDDVIWPALSRGESVTLHFTGAAVATQSFVHALLAGPIRRLGRERLEAQVRVADASFQVKDAVRIVAGYVLAEREGRGGEG